MGNENSRQISKQSNDSVVMITMKVMIMKACVQGVEIKTEAIICCFFVQVRKSRMNPMLRQRQIMSRWRQKIF